MNIFKRVITFRPSFAARVIAGLTAVLLIVVACTITGVADLSRALAFRDTVYQSRLIEEGARSYADQCARCHGTEGKGIEGQGPALSSRNFFENRIREIGWNGTLESYIGAVTRAGIPLKSSNVWDVTHPPFLDRFGGPLRDDQVENIVRFVMNWRQTPTEGPDVVDAPAPGEAFVPRPTPVPLTPEQEAGKEVFLKNGCNACHMIKGVANGNVGPDLSILFQEAEHWIASPEYAASQGQATTPEAYIRESIINPAAFLTPECPQGPCQANLMPPNYSETIPADDLNKLVDYLSSLGRPAP